MAAAAFYAPDAFGIVEGGLIKPLSRIEMSLGAAIGESAVAASLAKRSHGLQLVATRLATVDRHDALALLRLSLGHPRAIYQLRAGASFRDPEAVDAYDEALRDTTELALNIRLDNRAWLQCSLPLRLGGIGIRAPSDLALQAF